MADYIYYNGELYHASRKQHKYITKVPIGNGKYRYFYTREEYNSYKNDKENKETDKKSKTKSVSNFFADIFKRVKKLFKKSKKQVSKTLEKGKKFVDEVIFGKNGGKNKLKRNFLYIARVKLANGKYRYFYDQDEYNRYLKRQEYQKNEPDFMKKVSKISDEDIFAASDIMKKVNPDYSPYDDATGRNCANCTAAYELRCRGYDVKAAEYENVGEYFINGTTFRHDYYYKDAKKITLDSDGNEYKSALNGTKLQKDFDYSASKVESSIVKLSGKSTRGDISVEWKSGGGHSMVYEVNDNGAVVIRDCQTNNVYDVGDIAGLVNHISITRTDNLELRKGIMNAVVDAKGGN